MKADKYPLLFSANFCNETGLIKPSVWSWCVALWSAKGVLFLVLALASFEQGERLIRLVFPVNLSLWCYLLSALPAVIGLGLMSWRNYLVEHNKQSWFKLLLPLLLLALCIECGISFYALHKQDWHFSLLLGGMLVMNFWAALLLLSSRRFKLMLQSWMTLHH